MRRALLLAPVALLVMAACGGDDDDDAVADSVPVASTTPSASVPDDTRATPDTGSLGRSDDTVSRVSSPSTPPGSGGGSGPRGTADERAAVVDLAARQGVETTAITVVSTDEVTWRDGSMGCPEPGMNYTQALVPGIRVVLELDGVRYEYHSGGGRSMFLCEKPQQPADG
jgi:hypothetical protein